MPIANLKHRRRLDRDPPIALDEWPRYRDIRLQALQESPHAFGSTWEAGAAREDRNGTARITAAASGDTDRALFAVNAQHVCGLVWCKLSATEPSVADLYQMWVVPRCARHGRWPCTCGHSQAAANWGLQWHVIAMHSPSLFTGHPISR